MAQQIDSDAAMTERGARERDPLQAEDRRLVFRELAEPAEVVTLLRLRHRIYFEECAYGAQKPLGLDLTVHDLRSRLFGVFRAGLLVGGLRIVLRAEQRLAPALRAIHAVVRDSSFEDTCSLPSEEAFALQPVLGARHALVDAEVGRFVVVRSAVDREAVLQIMVATLAVLYLERCRLYLYSCASELAERYAQVAQPRWQLNQDSAGILSDGFPFPRLSVAGVAAVEDSPHLQGALCYARELARVGSIRLTESAVPGAVRTPSSHGGR
jgi:hypothetical protein